MAETSNRLPSIDPTINSSAKFAQAESLAQLTISDDCVYLFDFDGVIASRIDDDVYKLEPESHEPALLARAAEQFGIRCHDMEIRYQRHLLYQAAAWKLNLPLAPGPGFAQAKEAGERAQLFILTARSGWHAVARMRRFMQLSQIKPVEIFNVGRVRKDRQIELLCREFPHKQTFYIENSAAHLADAANIVASNLKLVSIDSDLQPPRAEAYQRAYFHETLTAAMVANWRVEMDHDWPNTS